MVSCVHTYQLDIYKKTCEIEFQNLQRCELCANDDPMQIMILFKANLWY